MKAINLFALTRIKNNDIFSLYDSILSTRQELKKTKSYEQKSLEILVDEILKHESRIVCLDGFYFSYVIKQIGKEFDLLKFSNDLTAILNIELKSEPVSIDDIKSQLCQNKYYLSHISSDIRSYTYISSTNELYHLDKHENLNICKFEELIVDLKSIETYFDSGLDYLFKAVNFLISPLNTPTKFLSNNYFLTNQQEDIKKHILNQIKDKSDYLFISITGSAGTGKTLVLYDIAKFCTALGKVCMIHCGILCTGHIFLNENVSNLDIIPIKIVNDATDFSQYSYIFLDETQRIWANQFHIIENAVKNDNKCCIYSYDPTQILSNAEKNRDIASQIMLLSKHGFKLSEKIRTNKEISSFIISLFNLKRRVKMYEYRNVDIVFATNIIEAYMLIDYYRKRKYTFINFTSSNFNPTSFDKYSGDFNTHEVIGQEFDNVLMVLDNHFYYNESDQLSSSAHPNPDYLYDKLLFQGVTRTRERLCIIIIENFRLFENILSIKSIY